jgi:hypothetical protein
MTIVWGWFWRMLLIALGTGGVAGTIFSIVIGVLVKVAGGVDPSVFTYIVFVFWAVLGMFTTHPLIRWLLSSRVGGYKIVLCRRREDDQIVLDAPETLRKVAL